MNVNGTDQSFEGISLSEIGELLREASPTKDGVGLEVKLSTEEQMILAEYFGLNIGYAIHQVIEDAVKAVGGGPKLRYTYSDHVFRTEAVA